MRSSHRLAVALVKVAMILSAAVLVVTLGTHGNVLAQDAPPLTPGRLALLVDSSGDSVTSLRLALASSSAPLRTTAARLVAVSQITALMPDLVIALSAEKDARAQGEMTRALVLFNTDDARRVLDALLPTLLPATIETMAMTMAQATPGQLLERLPAIRAQLGERALLVVRAPIMLAAQMNPSERLTWLRAALKIASGSSWNRFLGEISERDPGSADVAVLSEALTGADASVRHATVWHLMIHASDEPALAPALVDLAVRGVGQPDAPETWEQFGREIIARVRRRAQTPDRSNLIRREALAHLESTPDDRPAWYALTPGEQRALREAIGSRSWADAILDQKRPAPLPTPAAPTTSSRIPMRTYVPPAPGFLKELFTASSCEPGDQPRFGALVATYRPDGRIASASLDLGTLEDKCRTPLKALARVMLNESPETIVAGAPEAVIVPIWQPFSACTDVMHDPALLYVDALANAPKREHREGPAPRFDPPRKIKDQAAIFPPQAQKNRAEGTVEIEAVITSAGCVRRATVTKTPNALFDFPALRAVMQWQYAPLSEAFRGLDVAMTVFTKFSLR